MLWMRTRDSCDPKSASLFHQTHHSAFIPHSSISVMNSDQSAALKVHQKGEQSQISIPPIFVADHDTARTELSIAPLTWDNKLAKYAQQYANQLASTNSGMQHSNQLSQQRQGENLASCPGPWPNPYRESSKLWYAERKNWKGGVFQAQATQVVGHYTQVSRDDEETVTAQQTDTRWYV